MAKKKAKAKDASALPKSDKAALELIFETTSDRKTKLWLADYLGVEVVFEKPTPVEEPDAGDEAA